MERTTKVVETPIGKHKVELYEFITGGTKRKMSNTSVASERQEIVLKAVIKSIDGNELNVLESLDNMHGQDFDFVSQELLKVLNDSSLTDEKKGQ